MDFAGYLLAAIIVILIFLAVREIFCWYWKINTIIDDLEIMNNNLEDRLESIDKKLSQICKNGINVKIISDINADTTDDTDNN